MKSKYLESSKNDLGRKRNVYIISKNVPVLSPSVYMERLGLGPVSHCFPIRSNSVCSPECRLLRECLHI